jgi:SAM-dependent methyltransferase
MGMKLFGWYIGHKTQNQILMLLTIILAIIMVWMVYKRNHIVHQEGFIQNEHFLVKRQQDVYDDFTAQIYDKIFRPKQSNQFVFDATNRLTQMDNTKSVILDAGCGTGELANYIEQSGYKHVYGVDQSQDMIQVAINKNPNLKLKQADLTHPMAYDKNTFTHIFMTGMTIYDFQDKTNLFRNLYYWLIPNGYLILQVVDRSKFDPIPPTGKPLLVDSIQMFVEERVTNTEIDFQEFTYKSSYDFSNLNQDTALFQETFTDKATRNVRMNEKSLYMEEIDDIIYKAQYAGFLVHGQMNMGDVDYDKYKYVFILERPN